MKEFLRSFGAGLIASVMPGILAATVVGAGALMPTSAMAQYSLPPVTISINKLRLEMDLQIMMDDMMQAYAGVLASYDTTLAVSTDPQIPTRDNDARCNQKAKEKLNGMTMSNSTAQQKVDKTNEMIAMWRGNPANGGLGVASPGQPTTNGWSSMYRGLPKEPGAAFKELQIIAVDGSSWTARIYVPGGSGGDPNGALATAILDNKSAASTTGGAANPSACPRAG